MPDLAEKYFVDMCSQGIKPDVQVKLICAVVCEHILQYSTLEGYDTNICGCFEWQTSLDVCVRESAVVCEQVHSICQSVVRTHRRAC
jgi:hypothetical protein